MPAGFYIKCEMFCQFDIFCAPAPEKFVVQRKNKSVVAVIDCPPDKFCPFARAGFSVDEQPFSDLFHNFIIWNYLRLGYMI